MEPNRNPDGSFRQYTALELDAMQIKTRGVRDGSNPTHTRRVGSTTIRCAYQCAWAYREQVVAAFLGAAGTYIDTLSGQEFITRLLPRAHEDNPNAYATALESMTGRVFDGMKAAARNTPVYETAELVFLFETLPYALKTDVQAEGDETQRYIEHIASENSAEYLTIPGSFVNYLRADGVSEGNPKPHLQKIPFSIGIRQPKSIVRKKQWRLPWDIWFDTNSKLYLKYFGDPDTGERSWIGTVNTETLWNRYPPGTALLMAPSEEPIHDPLGDGMAWNLTHCWEINPNGWNNLYFADTSDPTGGGESGYHFVARGDTHIPPESLTSAHDRRVIYPGRDHRLLFTDY